MDEDFLFLNPSRELRDKVELILDKNTLEWVKNLSQTLSSLEKHKDGSWNGSGHATKKLSYLNTTLIQITAVLIFMITFFIAIRLYVYDQWKNVKKPKSKEDDFD